MAAGENEPINSLPRRPAARPSKLAGGLSRVQERAKPASPTSAVTTMNGTSTLARDQTKRRSTQGACPARLSSATIPSSPWRWRRSAITRPGGVLLGLTLGSGACLGEQLGEV